jgi:hypothetical protein
MKWHDVPTGDIEGSKSLVNFVADSFDPIIVAIFDKDEEDPYLFIVNDEKLIEPLEKKAKVWTAQEALDFLGSQIVPKVVITTFPDSKFIEVGPMQPEKEEE